MFNSDQFLETLMTNFWDAIGPCLDLTVEKTRLEALQFVIECSKHKMDVIINPPVLRKSNNTLIPFKRNSHFDADNTKDSDNSFTRNQKEIKKNQYEK